MKELGMKAAGQETWVVNLRNPVNWSDSRHIISIPFSPPDQDGFPMASPPVDPSTSTVLERGL